MVTNEEIATLLQQNPEVVHVNVTGDGYHYNLTVVSKAFQNKNQVARSQWVYAILNDYISTGRMHAVSMQTLTPAEWGHDHG